MDLQKILCTIFTILLSLYLSDAASYHRRHSVSNPRRNNDEYCICYPKTNGKIPVSPLVDNHGLGTERLVVFIYRNPTTQVVTLYTPDPDKQQSIPDLPYDSGDIIQHISMETILDLFYKSPNVVKRYVTNAASPTGSNQQIGYNLLNTDITNFPNVLNSPNGLNQQSEYSFLHTDVTNFPNLPDSPNMQNLKNLPDLPNVSELPNGSNQQFGYNLLNTDVTQDLPIVSNLLDVIKSPNEPSSPNTPHVPNVPNLSYGPDVSNAPHPITNDHDAMEDSAEVTSDNQIFDVPVSEEIIEKPDVSYESNDIIGDSQSQGQVQGVKAAYKLNGSYHGHVNDFQTFDKWFQMQMARFHNIQASIQTNQINVVTLKVLIERTLQENNIYVSSNGLLVDVNGVAFDTSNLLLRPILIGNSMEYENIVQNTNNFILPRNSPYLEALLVSLLKPPKVLGIIPLGIAMLPPDSAQEYSYSSQYSAPSGSAAHHVSTQGASAVHQVGSSEGTTVQHTSFSGAYHGPPDQTITNGRRIIPGYIDPKNKNYTRQVLAKRRFFKRKQQNTNGINKASETDLLGLSNLRNIIQRVFSFVGPGGNGQDSQGISSEEDQSAGWDSDEDEGPGFRIIGGNPATGSGTPVNIKGRAGNNNY